MRLLTRVWRNDLGNKFFSLILICSLFDLASAQDRHSHLPNPKLTPGDALNLIADDLCDRERTDLEDNLSVKVKRQVFDRYGIGPSQTGYNIDHLIPVKLGGSSSLKNLWPQPISGQWNHNRKNQLERRLHKMVCNGLLDLRQAQEEISLEWVKAYKKYIGEPDQSSSKSSNTQLTTLSIASSTSGDNPTPATKLFPSMP